MVLKFTEWEVRFLQSIYGLMGERCWIWSGPVHDGKPMFNMAANTNRLAHHIALKCVGREKPKHTEGISWSCGEKLCVKPEHIVIAPRKIKSRTFMRSHKMCGVPMEERFWDKVEKTEGCWLWKAAVLPGGNGLFSPSRQDPISATTAHRVSWYLTHGSFPPKGEFVTQTCRNKICVRPEHLIVINVNEKRSLYIKEGDRFFSHVIKTHPCWLWRGPQKFTLDNGIKIPPALWMLSPPSPLKRKDKIIHECGNKDCVKIEHLRLERFQKGSPKPLSTIKERFLGFIHKTETCWPWGGPHSPDGYGKFRMNGKTMRAHRVSYMFYVDPELSDHLMIRHLCNNKRCVNPDHLAPGDAKDNAMDRKRSEPKFSESAPIPYTTLITAHRRFVGFLRSLSREMNVDPIILRRELFEFYAMPNASAGTHHIGA